MAATQYYVDPSIAGDSGAGTIGDPYGDLQYALDTITRDTTNGDQINIKAGTAEILAAAITFATYGTPSTSAPLTLRGYTSAADDGGIGAIDANSFSLFASTSYQPGFLVDLELSNFGTAQPIHVAANTFFINCEIHTGTYTGDIIDMGSYCLLDSCYIHDIGNTNGSAVYCSQGCLVQNCFIDTVCQFGIEFGAAWNTALRNIVIHTATAGASIAIKTMGATSSVMFNSIYNKGSGSNHKGIDVNGVACVIIGNVVEGYSGASEIGIFADGEEHKVIRNNRWYDCTTGLSLIANHQEDNSVLTASGFTDAASDDFSPSAELIASGWPSNIGGSGNTTTSTSIDIGASQSAGAGGGGLLRSNGMNGGFNG